jgi:methionine-R-sulfoxide reductase
MEKIIKIHKTDAEWKAQLSQEEYEVARGKGTEPPFCGLLLGNKDKGTYTCVCCDLPIFDSTTKFESGTGWPSFYAAIDGHVEEKDDNAYGMRRTEILCARCDAHLGHVFPDGPPPTGKRYCLNSVSLKFVKGKKET